MKLELEIMSEIKNDPNFNKNYTEEQKLFAKDLYLRGVTLAEISEQIKETYGRRCDISLIKYWRDHENWEATAMVIVDQSNKKLAKLITTDLFDRHTKQLKAYQKMTDAGMKAIENEDVVVTRMSDAIDLIDRGIRGERQVAAGLVSLDLIQKLANIIVEEIFDEEAKKRVVGRFKKVALDTLRV